MLAQSDLPEAAEVVELEATDETAGTSTDALAKVLEDKRCAEEDLESRWGDEMKATELSQAASPTQLTGNPVNSNTVGGDNGKQSEHYTPSQVGVGEKSSVSVCNSTRNSRRKPKVVRRRPGRPRKRKVLAGNRTDHDTSVIAAVVQHKEVSTTLPLPTRLENHNTGKLPDAIDDNLNNDSLHRKDSDPHAVPAGKVESGDSLLPKKRRGRPKKEENTDFQNTLSTVAASFNSDLPNVNNVDIPTRRLRRKWLPSTQDENFESHGNADPQQTEPPPKESNEMSNFQAVKRRRQKCQVDDQVPEKMSKLVDSQEAVSPINRIDCTVTEKTDQQKGLDGDKPECDTNGKDARLFAQTGEEQEQQSNEHTPPPRVLPSQLQPAAASPEDTSNLKTVSSSLAGQPEKKISAELNGSKESQSETPDSCESPVDADLQKKTVSGPGVAPTSEEVQKSVAVLLEPKEEDVEVELDSLNPAPQPMSHESVENGAKSTIEAERLPDQRNIFRRKRGGKRRRRIAVRNVVVPKEDHDASHEGNWDGEHKADPDAAEENVEKQANLDGNAKVIYVKKGGKTHLKCGYCGRVFKFQSQFIIHQRVHTGERPYKCPECDKGFSKNSNLNLHLKTHRKKHMYHKCPFCSIKFSSPEYASHMEMHAQEFVQEYKNNNPEKPNGGANCDNSEELEKTQEKRERKLCQYCGKSFQFQSALVRHVRVHTGEKPYKCDICGKAFGQAYFLRVHELTHWSVKRYNCTRCEKSFTHYSNAKNHTCRPVGGDGVLQANRCLKPSLTYTCHICKNVFDHLQAFNGHMRDHTGAKLYRCVYCDKLFGVLSEFTAHHSLCKADRPASGIKQETSMSLIKYTVPALRCNSAPVTAETCETQKKRFQVCRKSRRSDANKPFQSTVIRAHPLSHLVSKLNKLDTRSDPRKYLCPACGRLFRHMGRLRAHMLTHSPNQSYSCACCGKTLGNWKKLLHHQRVHRQRQGRFACPQCGQGFRFAETYKKHMREHSEFKWVEVKPRKVSLPYQCEVCKCSFQTLDLLFRHELCHSSPPEGCKEPDLELSLEDPSTHPSKKTLSPADNRSTLKSSSSAQHPAAAAQQPPADSKPSIVHRPSLDSADSSGQPIRSHSVQGTEAGQGRTNEHAPVLPLRSVKNTFIQNARRSKEESSDGAQCAVCGKAYSALSDLYQHYLQHARGQV